MIHWNYKPERKRIRRTNCDSPPQSHSNNNNNKSNDDNWCQYDAYEYTMDIHDWVNVKIRKRPLPLLSSLVGMATHSRNENDLDDRKIKVKDRVKHMPFLEDYFQKYSPETHQTQPSEINETTNDNQLVVPVLMMEDSNNSTITQKQHERYFILRDKERHNQISNKDRNSINEFKKLKDLIYNERAQYAKAIENFRDDSYSRFLVGFTTDSSKLASNYVHRTSQLIHIWKERWKKNSMPLTYGKYNQAISLHDSNSSIHQEYEVFIPKHDIRQSSQHSIYSNRLSLDLFPSQIVSSRFIDQSKKVHAIDLHHVSTMENSYIQPQKMTNTNKHTIHPTNHKYSSPLLIHDKHALKLALQYRVSTIMTSQTLTTIIQTPGLQSTRWKIPVSVYTYQTIQAMINVPKTSISTTISILEDPVPQSCTTRENLTQGFEDPFMLALLDQNYTSSTPITSYSNNDPKLLNCDWKNQIQYVYTIIHIPSTSVLTTFQKQNKKILVRSINFIYAKQMTTLTNSTSSQNISSTNLISKHSMNPIRPLIQLEYFPERGMEEYTNNSRATWIIEKLLQPNAHIIVGRINPSTGKIHQIEEKSISSAISNPYFKLDHHFIPLINFIKALKNIRVGNHLLCLPAYTHDNQGLAQSIPLDHSTTVSVHTSCQTKSSNHYSNHHNKDVVIDMEKECLESESVFMSKNALISCFRMWNWAEKDHPGQIPYTFPIKK